jgi:hypothetical protein
MNKTLFISTICPVAVITLWLLGAPAFGQNLNPVAFDGLRQWTGESPFVLGWGYGEVFGGGNVIDETVADFQLSGFSPGHGDFQRNPHFFRPGAAWRQHPATSQSLYVFLRISHRGRRLEQGRLFQQLCGSVRS